MSVQAREARASRLRASPERRARTRGAPAGKEALAGGSSLAPSAVSGTGRACAASPSCTAKSTRMIGCDGCSWLPLGCVASPPPSPLPAAESGEQEGVEGSAKPSDSADSALACGLLASRRERRCAGMSRRRACSARSSTAHRL